MKYTLGDIVEANWKGGGCWFQGRIADCKDAEVFVEYLDGDREWIADERLIRKIAPIPENTPIPYQRGDTVEGNWKARGVWYAGVVRDIKQNVVLVHYMDGDKEWINDLSRLRPFTLPSPAEYFERFKRLMSMASSVRIDDAAAQWNMPRKQWIAFVVSHTAAFDGVKIEGDFITGFPKGTLEDEHKNQPA